MRPQTEDKVNILVVDDLADKRLAFRSVLDDLDENLVLVGSGARRCASCSSANSPSLS